LKSISKAWNFSDAMRIGILSDTHAHVIRSIRAIEALLSRDVKAVLHCGDIGSDEVLEEIAARCAAHGVSFHAVLGNVDEYAARSWRGMNRRPIKRHEELTLDGKRIALIHGHHVAVVERAIASGRYDYICTGHTHQRRDERIGRTRIINPGAVYRANPPTVALLDLASDRLEFIEC
jgi:putative phosphoesterase